MRNCSIKAIVLGHRNFGEYHKLVFLYTEEFGKIKVVAKGARKITSKFSGHLETLNFVKVNLYFAPKSTLITEIETLKSFNRFDHKDLEKISNALQIAEVTNKLIYENQSLENLIELLESTLSHINSSQKHELITQSYIIKLLDKVGHIPDFTSINTKIEKKYLKFFNFIQKQSFADIEKISLSLTEKQEIRKITKQLLSLATG